MTQFYDALETRSADERAAQHLTLLQAQIMHAKARARRYSALLADIEPISITSLADLARLPVVRKSDLIDQQRAELPFAGLNATRLPALARVFASPGPIYDPEGYRPDYWRTARALFAAGIRGGELVHNCFSYHFTPAGSMFESGAHALGCPVFPGGVGQTEMQVRALADLGAAAYVGTPSFLKLILEKADELGVALPRLTKALVSGEALPCALRDGFDARGVTVTQCYGTADLGLIAYETAARDGLVVDEGVVVEIVRPGTGDPLAVGEVGEVVVTSFNPDYPLIRFATGDLSAFHDGPSPCGRTGKRLKGWMGRADQTTKIKGMFVHPAQIADLVKRHPEISKARLTVTRDAAGGDVMTLAIIASTSADGFAAGVGETLTALTKLRGGVALVETLPNDGKVIDDQRPVG